MANVLNNYLDNLHTQSVINIYFGPPGKCLLQIIVTTNTLCTENIIRNFPETSNNLKKRHHLTYDSHPD